MKRVLIVDKNDKSAHVLSSALKRKGYIVKHSQTSNDALRLSDQLNPDIVILHDLNTGTDETLIAEMILQPKLDHTAFVFVSEIMTDNKVRESSTCCSMKGSSYAVYPKPVKVDKLLEEIKCW